ncbi:MAG: accessory factor UbiK family protein [Candidatus Endonucleobacter bathymodioli]|uniref:Ubiquinone biosynthesis accessory factor UbiK n=1 Tax=Candidatus Endonucleibacter bathymodioli TaxID=539814 RepID=A0AA90STH0_9GAMM|nr:accessory factor UbiK family protein [Candidatus Endonucleobacter bathymodioli]
MIDKVTLINTIAEKVGKLLGGEKGQAREDLENNIKAIVTSALSRLDLVNRDEFDSQAAVLRHAREKLDMLESAVAGLKCGDKLKSSDS